jgi:hypothetical protein
MKISQEEKNRILEMHSIEKKSINEGIFGDIWQGIKGIPQGFIYNRTLSNIVGKIDRLLKQSLKNEDIIHDLQQLRTELQGKNMSTLQISQLEKSIDYIVQNHEQNKRFLTDLRGALKKPENSSTQPPTTPSSGKKP